MPPVRIPSLWTNSNSNSVFWCVLSLERIRAVKNSRRNRHLIVLLFYMVIASKTKSLNCRSWTALHIHFKLESSILHPILTSLLVCGFQNNRQPDVYRQYCVLAAQSLPLRNVDCSGWWWLLHCSQFSLSSLCILSAGKMCLLAPKTPDRRWEGSVNTWWIRVITVLTSKILFGACSCINVWCNVPVLSRDGMARWEGQAKRLTTRRPSNNQLSCFV